MLHFSVNKSVFTLYSYSKLVHNRFSESFSADCTVLVVVVSKVLKKDSVLGRPRLGTKI